jgi:CheY-like chemotaxis protein
MRLPLDARETQQTSPRIPDLMPARKASLLIIDDEESIRRALRRYFERRDWDVDEAPDGAAGLKKLEGVDATVEYDVVLCDLKMPGISGQELYTRLRTELPTAARKFIFATGDSGAPDVVDFLATVDVPVLEKPFELRSLEQIAQQVRAEGVARGENN